MAQINKEAFAFQIQQYHKTRKSDEKELEAALRTCAPDCGGDDIHSRPEITFGHTGELALMLIERAYNRLTEKPSLGAHSCAVAEAIQNFAFPFGEKQVICYPHFLLHGIDQPDLEGIAAKIEDNARIIHETRKRWQEVHNTPVDIKLENDLKLGRCSGSADDYFGICYFLSRTDEKHVHGCYGYTAKFSIFADTTNKEIYGITVQGQQIKKHVDRFGNTTPDKKKGREYARLAAKLGMDPRAYTIKKVMDLLREEGFKRIKIIRPEHHPMSIEKHNGFYGNYEPAIRQAGICEENETYLESVI